MCYCSSGGTDGTIRVFDLAAGSEKTGFRVCHDTVNGCQYHPFLPVIATASGERHLRVSLGSLCMLPESTHIAPR